MRLSIIAAAIAFGAALASPAMASEVLPQPLARQLDQQAAEFTMTAAKQRRLYMMQETTRRQQYGRGGPGYNRGYGARPRYGYGPGYGPRPGYGPPRGYGYRRY